MRKSWASSEVVFRWLEFLETFVFYPDATHSSVSYNARMAISTYYLCFPSRIAGIDVELSLLSMKAFGGKSSSHNTTGQSWLSYGASQVLPVVLAGFMLIIGAQDSVEGKTLVGDKPPILLWSSEMCRRSDDRSDQGSAMNRLGLSGSEKPPSGSWREVRQTASSGRRAYLSDRSFRTR